MRYVFNDGGRKASGRKGKSKDCAVRAAAIIFRMRYDEAHRLFSAMRRKPRCLARHGTRTTGGPFVRFMASKGYTYTSTARRKTVFGVTPLPPGRILVETPGHISAVLNGVLHDSFNGTLGRPWKVLGYWRKTNASDAEVKVFLDKFLDRWHIVV